VVVVSDPQRQGDQEEQVGHGQVHHEDLDLIQLLGRVQVGKDPQHVAIGDHPQHKDDAVNDGEESVPELRVHTQGLVLLHRARLRRDAAHGILAGPGRPHRILVNREGKRDCQTGCQWLTPVILATGEAEIRRIAV
jgi:hypothetical protein